VKYNTQNVKPTAPDIPLALGGYRLSDAAIQIRLRKLIEPYKDSFSTLEELRNDLHREMGDKSLTEELRRLRDEE